MSPHVLDGMSKIGGAKLSADLRDILYSPLIDNS
jgi:hypothetical protein